MPRSEEIEKSLEVKGIDKDKNSFIVSCFEISKCGEYIGVPRNFRNLADKVQWDFPNIDWPTFNGFYRDGQQDAVSKAYDGLLKNLGGIVELHTGFGKSLVSLIVASKLRTPTLVICHKEDLLQQFQNTAKTFFGIDVGWVQGDRLDYKNRQVTVATVQTLNSRISSIPKDFWSNFGFIIFDEGHRFPTASFGNVVNRLSAKYRLGMSATFRRKDKLDRIWELHLGDNLFESHKKGIPGIYLQHEIRIDGVNDQKYFRNGSYFNSKMISDVGQSARFAKEIARTANHLAKCGRRTVILSDRVEQLYLIKDYLDHDFGYYIGSHQSEVNGKIKYKKVSSEELEKAKKATTILAIYKKIAEGSDIPALDTVIFATPKHDVEQSVGRIQRPHANKQVPLIVDLVPKTKYNTNMAIARSRLYSRLGFKEIKDLSHGSIVRKSDCQKDN